MRKFVFPTRHNSKPFVSSYDDIKYTIGNPVLYNKVNVYLIYYGNWTLNQKTILESFVKHIGNSSWFNVQKKYYYQKSNNTIKLYTNGPVILASTAIDNYSHGKHLKDNAIPEIIQKKIDSNELPEDPTGVYFILTSGDVSETIRPDLGDDSFCESYCGYHVSSQMKSKVRLFYSFVGNPTSCIDGCGQLVNSKASPNGDIGVDAMLSVIAHELVEAISDPVSDIDDQRAWQDSTGYENADKCAWTFGPTKRDSKGATYNLQMEDKNYLIQQNWNPESQKCGMNASN